MAFGPINQLNGSLLAGIMSPAVANPVQSMQEAANNELVMQQKRQDIQSNDVKAQGQVIQQLYFDSVAAFTMPYEQRKKFIEMAKNKYKNIPQFANSWEELSNMTNEEQIGKLYDTIDIASKAGFGMPKTEDGRTTNIKEAEYATGGEGPESRKLVGDVLKKKGDPTTNVNVGDRIPQGYFKDETTGELKPIPGGPVDVEYKANVNRLAQNLVVGKQHAQNMFELIGNARDKIGAFKTGIPGKLSSLVPGTDAYTLGQTLDTIKANLGFERLQEMREMSKTGGALGQVSERELSQLERALRSLEQGQDKEALLQNLSKVEEHYNNWLNNLNKFSLEGAKVYGVDESRWKDLTHTSFDNRSATDTDIDRRGDELKAQGMSDVEVLKTLASEGYPIYGK